MDKKIGIMSMQRIINYGSFLQAYGLKKMIESVSKSEVEFIDYRFGVDITNRLKKPQSKAESIVDKILKNRTPWNYLKKKNFFKEIERNLILDIAESVMRFGLDKDADKEKNTQCGSIVLLIAMIIGLVLIPICRCITEVSDYAMYVYFYVISLSASQLFLCDLRGKELLLKYSLGNILQTLMIAILNITFLLVFKMETGGYLLAYIIANFIVAIYAIIAGKGYKAFSFHNIDRCKLKEMIRYSVVLIPNTFMWWIMNSSDRVMVTYMIGAAANGIYAVSYKLPTLVSTLTGIFNQAWSYSAIREEGTSDETEYNNKMFKTLSAIAFMMGIGLLLLTKPFLGVYVADSYYDAWKYTPFLIIGCVYLTLGTFMQRIFTFSS